MIVLRNRGYPNNQEEKMRRVIITLTTLIQFIFLFDNKV